MGRYRKMKENSVYERWFGVKPIIPLGFPWMSQTGGARLPTEVVEVMSEAAKYKVDMTELLLQAGKTVANIIGAEAAFITSGTCAALTLGTAAVMTGKDIVKMEQLPNTDYPIRLKNEFIIQTGMFIHYVNCFRASGGKLIWVGGKGSDMHMEYDPKTMRVKANGFGVLPKEIEEAINERTAGIIAAIHCAPSIPPPCTVPTEEVIKIAKKHNIPTIADASHLPSAGGKRGRAFLRRYLDMGVDLVCVSGGKAIEGPNNTGIIYGRKDLVEAAAPQGAPGIPLDAGTPEETRSRYTMVGRGFKVSKEQIVGLVAALKRYVAMDDEAVTARDIQICNWMADQFKDFPHVKVVGLVPENDWPNDNMFEGGPSCILEVDEEALGIKITDLPKLMLQENEPLVDVSSCLKLAPWGKLQLYSHGIRDGEEELVIRRLKKVLGYKG